MLPNLTVQDSEYSPAQADASHCRRQWLLQLIFILFCISGSKATSAQDAIVLLSEDSDTTTIAPTASAPIIWDAEHVVTRAIHVDPIRNVLIDERRLAQSQRSGHHSSCAVQNWVTSHLDQRIARREQEVRSQVLKLHFGLAEVQSQTLVLDELQSLRTQYADMVAKIAEAEEATDLLAEKGEELSNEIEQSQLQLNYSLSQIRIQLGSLLQCPEAAHYWPAEPLIIQFQPVDIEQQVALAKQQRSDVALWQSTPRIAGTADELAKIEKLLSASWLVVPTSVATPPLLKLLAHSKSSSDIRRQWSIRKQQMQELARAKSIELETDVRLKALSVNQAYLAAEASQLTKQQATARLQSFEKRQAAGVPQPDRYWEAAFELQSLRAESFRKLGEARQAEIELDFATGSQRSWLPAIEATNAPTAPTVLEQ